MHTPCTCTHPAYAYTLHMHTPCTCIHPAHAHTLYMHPLHAPSTYTLYSGRRPLTNPRAGSKADEEHGTVQATRSVRPPSIPPPPSSSCPPASPAPPALLLLSSQHLPLPSTGGIAKDVHQDSPYWYVVYGVWCMVCGVWCMVYGVWYMVCIKTVRTGK
jgi:hypothetical protein